MVWQVEVQVGQRARKAWQQEGELRPRAPWSSVEQPELAAGRGGCPPSGQRQGQRRPVGPVPVEWDLHARALGIGVGQRRVARPPLNLGPAAPYVRSDVRSGVRRVTPRRPGVVSVARRCLAADLARRILTPQEGGQHEQRQEFHATHRPPQR